MTERPIIFSGPMVRAILEGRKTQTRRIYKPRQPEPWEVMDEDRLGKPWPYWQDEAGQYHARSCPYGVPGDRLWVREAWRVERRGAQLLFDFAADTGAPTMRDVSNLPEAGHYATRVLSWRPSIHMPRWASRLTLEVTDVRVQRLKEISEEDARAEGIQETRLPLAGADGAAVFHAGEYPTELVGDSHRNAFSTLWDSINGKRASWAGNPWVWALTFKIIQGDRSTIKGETSNEPAHRNE